MKAMILAAGPGTRLKPITNHIPKALVSIDGKTLLEHQILKLKSAGFNEIIVNVHHFADQIIEFLQTKNNFNIRIEISDERDCLLDTGGAIRKAAWFFDDGKPFLVHNVDILSNVDLKNLIDFHQNIDNLATLVVNHRKTSRWLLFDKQMQLKGWYNETTGQTKPQGINLQLYQRYAFSGIQILSPKVFELMEKWNKVFSIIDFYLSCVEKEIISGYTNDEIKVLDVGKIQSLEDADIFLKNCVQ
ncbi:MAG: nucleotidyltransferase family protein [Bacteroidales bacterium]|nr:nucleotidyltransferase family protein [Bacteroidales bacterium]